MEVPVPIGTPACPQHYLGANGKRPVSMLLDHFINLLECVCARACVRVCCVCVRVRGVCVREKRVDFLLGAIFILGPCLDYKKFQTDE